MLRSLVESDQFSRQDRSGDSGHEHLKKSRFVASYVEDVNTRVEIIKKKLLMSVIHNPFHVLRDTA